MPTDGSTNQRFPAMEFAHTRNMPTSAAPHWVALAAFSFLNVFAGIFLLPFFFRASSLVTGFAACVILLGVSYFAWFVAGVELFRENLVGVSLLASAAGASACACLLMRAFLSSRFATGFSSFSYQVARDPFALARLWISVTYWLTFLSLFYAATSAFLFYRFRHASVMPRLSVLARVFIPSRGMLDVFLWWLGLNSFGVVFSFFLVSAGRFEGTLYGNTLFLGILILLGALQALTSCWLISMVRIRNKTVLMVLGPVVGLVTAFGFMFLGMFVLWFYAALGFWPFAGTGVVFGAIAGHVQSRPLATPSKAT